MSIHGEEHRARGGHRGGEFLSYGWPRNFADFWFVVGEDAVRLKQFRLKAVRLAGMARGFAENRKLGILSADFADYRRLRSACNIARETLESREQML
jgi:hypothetical protein